MPETAYEFGNEVGEEMSKDVLRNAWERLRDKPAQAWKDTKGQKGVDLKGLHLADLRHEGASRFDELDIPTAQKEILGHADLKTTTRYVNPSERAIRKPWTGSMLPILQILCKKENRLKRTWRKLRRVALP